MFDWSAFRSLALAAGAAHCKDDANLSRLLAADSPAKEQTDEIGRPMPESVGIHQMTDIENLKRALRIRRGIAHDEGNTSYVSYSDVVLSFLDSISAGEVLFAVLIATKKASYEFLFAPQLKKTTAEKVTV